MLTGWLAGRQAGCHRKRLFLKFLKFASGFSQYHLATLNYSIVCAVPIYIVRVDLHAEVSCICHIQAKSFVKELEFLRGHGKQLTPTYVQQYELFLDDKHVMKCNGRINNSLAEKNSIFLPIKHPLIKLLVMHVRHQVKPGGVNVTLTALHERF